MIGKQNTVNRQAFGLPLILFAFYALAKRMPLDQQQDTARGGRRLNIRNGVDLDQSQDSNGCACKSHVSKHPPVPILTLFVSLFSTTLG
jgi:hypothetical protein